MPFLSPRAFSRASPSAVPMSSTRWWSSMCVSPLARTERSIPECLEKRSSMWSTKGIVVRASPRPFPSRFRERVILVSFVFLATLAVLFIFLTACLQGPYVVAQVLRARDDLGGAHGVLPLPARPLDDRVPFHEVLHGKSRTEPGRRSRGQDMARPGRIVAQGHGGRFSQEYRSGVPDEFQDARGFGQSQVKVLRRYLIDPLRDGRI